MSTTCKRCSKSSARRRWIIAAVLCAWGAHYWNTSRRVTSVPPSRPVYNRTALVGFNTSASHRPFLPAAVRTASMVVPLLDPERDKIVMWRVDRSSYQLPGSTPPESSEEFVREVVPELRPYSDRPLTLTDRFWTRVVQEATFGDGSVYVLFFDDGHMEGLDFVGHHRVREAARRLATNPRVRAVCLIGSRVGTLEDLREDLAPLGDRLHFWSFEEAPSAFQALIDAPAGGVR